MGAVSESVLSDSKGLRRHFRVALRTVKGKAVYTYLNCIITLEIEGAATKELSSAVTKFAHGGRWIDRCAIKQVGGGERLLKCLTRPQRVCGRGVGRC